VKRWKRGQGAVRLLGQKFWIRYSLRGKRIGEPTNAENGTEARKILNSRLGEVSDGKTPAAASRRRLSELYEDMKADYRNNGADLGILAKRWKHLEPVFGVDFVASITRGRMQHYVNVRRDQEHASPATIQRESAALRRMLRLGYENRKVGQLPAFPRLTVHNVRSGFFERDEFKRLRAELPEHLRPLVTVAYWLGWRLSELLGLQWRQVNLDRGTVSLDVGSTKNGEGRLAYLPPEALEALKNWRDQTTAVELEKSLIVANVFHKQAEPIRDFRAAWAGACKRAGLPGRLFHDFRRTAARNYRRQGVSEGVVMKIGGRKTRTVFDRYDIKNEDDLREAAAMVSGSPIGKNWEKRAKVKALKPSAKARCAS
jgi:integrase